MRWLSYFLAGLFAVVGVAYAADTLTSNFGWTKPEIGSSTSTWGSKLNADLDSIDSQLKTTNNNVATNTTTANAALSRAGGTMTGDIVLYGSAPAGSTSAIPKSYADGLASSLNSSLATTNSNLSTVTTNANTNTANITSLRANTVSAGAGLSGGGTIISNPTISMPDTGVTAGSYIAPSLTINSRGQVTAATGGAFAASASVVVIKNNSTTPGTKIDVTANTALLTDSNGAPAYTSSAYITPCTINLSTTGDKGLDTGSLTTGWAYVYLQSNGSTFSCIASTSATSPSLTSGYNFSMRVGAMYMSSGVLRQSIQRGPNAQYIATTNSITAIPQVTSGGGNGTFSLATFVPSTATTVNVSLGNTGITADNASAYVGPSLNHAFFYNVLSYRSYGGVSVMQTSFVLEAQSLYYNSNDAQYRLWCNGWTDSVSTN